MRAGAVGPRSWLELFLAWDADKNERRLAEVDAGSTGDLCCQGRLPAALHGNSPVRRVNVGANVPVFVLEYLLGKYCATDDAAAIDAGLRVVNNAWILRAERIYLI